MSVPTIVIADAVVSAINGADLSFDVTSVRGYVPKWDLHSNTTVQIQVIPKSDTRQLESSDTDWDEAVIMVAVMKRLQSSIDDERDEIDALLEFVEEIRGELYQVSLGTADARCTEIRQYPIYSVDDMDGKRTFLTVLNVTYYVSLDL